MTLRAHLLAATLLLGGAPAVTYAAEPPPCAAIGFGTGRTVFCAYAHEPGAVVLRRSDDGGRRWGAERSVAADADVTGIVVSPRYDADTTVFVATSEGLYRSTDGGGTFPTAVASGVNARFVTPYVEGGPAGTVPHVALAWVTPGRCGSR